MKQSNRQIISIIFGILTLGTLIGITQGIPSGSEYGLYWFIFTGLIIFTTIFGIPLGGGEVSMLPMISLASLFVMGLKPAAWAAFTGALLYGLARYLWPRRVGWERKIGIFNLIGTTAANITMHTASILISGYVYLQLGGDIPLITTRNQTVFALFGAGAIYITSNYLIASLFLGMRGREHLTHYLRHIPNLLVYEVPPVVFAPLAAQIFNQLGWVQFGLFAVCILLISFVLRDQAQSHRHLQRRVQELDSLQIVGQALSTSLDIDAISESIYTEVSKLMPATNFFLALYNKDTDEVSFPLVYEYNERKNWRSRTMGKGLTEYILRSRAPLLIETNVGKSIEELGIESIGREALSWLGVPIMAGEEPLGVIAVQSYPPPDAIPQTYDSSHLEVLTTIATQASVAVQNARLYAQTDEALARRVQELNSILSTAHEGLLLLDKNLKVLAANRAFADFLGVPQISLLGQDLEHPDLKTTEPIISQIGFTQELLKKTLKAIETGKEESTRATIYITNGVERPLERVITPVLGEDQNVSGWLFVFRDLTEEHQLAKLREDFTHMLVHDLRAPIVTIRGGLDLIETFINRGETDELVDMVGIAKRGSDQMLDMINELLNVSKLEIGEMPLKIEPINLEDTYREIYERLSPIMKQIEITIEDNFAHDFPLIEGDANLLNRVVYNILDNALKFTPDKGLIEIWAKTDPENDAQILFGVKDDGPGISKEDQKRIFQKHQTISSTEGRRKGSGIGLYFCKLAVEALGGQIWAEGEGTRGSTFIIRLPIVAAKT